ncbi:CHAP domain-containing protein [Streptococcus chenjunshii]|uniref:CHAP domain-containing protein n=1 Tax=Streptococcus chenjunshii TaxID=2173853 RepID=A0A372KQE0_9STRE|nr:CHAP domain-containing protein [Streptococcus chenjunshii]AXQ78584.1 CHAP domain-containing protein [Streptococcus chenjunshii]RFU51952.1 CHAP domain-containing protein [Streptococcus chenjunshii]RFU54144.1 CHAP domain-containing protein [Streptococcus chenjunshii]
MKKAVLKVLIPLVSLVFLISIGVTILAGVLGSVGSSQSNCTTEVATSTSTDSSVSSGDGSIDSFVKEHEEAYILSWKAGGFLPSASITQTMIENGFNFSNPNGTSFWQAHNMGGVKTSSKSNFPITIATYGEDSVDLSGTKPGANVGDGTGGAYTWFSSYDAGIVGKAEFMAHQTLYTGAINNTDGKSTLSAIADGGWATDGTYKTKLLEMYDTLGAKYKWLDDKAIAVHGDKPYKDNTATSSSGTSSNSDSEEETSSDSGCDGDASSGDASDGTGIIPGDAAAWGYIPDNLPNSLKQYIIDPKSLGMAYGEATGWYQPGSNVLAGQCVNLTISLGNHLWGHSGSVFGNGKDQAAAWASIFGNSVKSAPKKGAIFSTQNGGGGYGHTGIVCHVFEDGSILIVEQNTPLSGWDYFNKPYTWNYRILTPVQQMLEITTFAYPDNKQPKLGN